MRETLQDLVRESLSDFADWLASPECKECEADIEELRDILVEYGLLRQKQTQTVELRSLCQA